MGRYHMTTVTEMVTLQSHHNKVTSHSHMETMGDKGV